MLRPRLPLALALAAIALAAAPGTASAASSYCSTTGDFCLSARSAPPVKLRLGLAAKYFDRHRLCVTAPGGARDCKRFAVRRLRGGIYGTNVRWSRHFPNRGHGVYRVRWLRGGSALGPRLTFSR
jgi:hypothetical protein